MPRQNIKHVHFAYIPPSVGTTASHDAVYSFPHSSPLTYLESSSSYPKSSSARNSGHVQLHPYLETSAIKWDMTDPPSMITRNDHHISRQTLCEPATSPPLGFMTIQTPYSPWTIKVQAYQSSYITLEDVFCAIYRSLRKNITVSEYFLFSSQSISSYATCAYQQRYRRHSSSRVYEEEKRNGMKRVDFLQGHSSFLGISNTCCQLDKWQFNVHKGPLGTTEAFRRGGILRRINHPTSEKHFYPAMNTRRPFI